MPDRSDSQTYFLCSSQETKQLQSEHTVRLKAARKSEGMAWLTLIGAIVVTAILGPFAWPLTLLGYMHVVFCYRKAELLATTDARLAMQDDRREPILYLRGFLDDGTRPEPNRLQHGCLMTLLPGLFQLTPFRATHEELIVQEMKRKGPVVAIGRPGERLPEGGAHRMYVDNHEWQHTVQALTKAARTIIVRLTDSEGIRWEFETVCRTAADLGEISVRRQCELLGLARSSYYHCTLGPSADDLRMMRLIDEQYLRTPFFGSRQMSHWLGRHLGEPQTNPTTYAVDGD